MTNPAGFPAYTIAGNGLVVPFNTGTPDIFGSFWYLDGEMQGWDSPDGRVTMLTRIGTGPNADGEYPADQHYRGRTLVFNIHASSSSEAARESSRYLLAQVLDLVGSVGTLTVAEAVPKFVTISRTGNNNQGRLVITDMGLSAPLASTPGFPTAPPEESTGNVYVVKAQVEVYCEDPRKYSPTSIVAPFAANADATWGATFNNPGNTRTQDLQLQIDAPAAGDLIFLSALDASFGGLNFAVPTTPGPALPGFPGQLNVDAYLQTIEDGSGNNVYYLRSLLNAPPWPSVPPGVGELQMSGGMAGLSGTLTYRPAWI